MLGRFRTRRSAVTFDLGSVGIRAFQVQRRNGRLSLCDSLELELPHDGKPAEDEQPAQPDARRLARLVGQGGFCGRDVAVVLSAPEVKFHTFRLPEQMLQEGAERIQAALKWEVAREMRLEPHEIEVRHGLLAPGHHQGLNVMAVAMPVRRAVEWFDLFRAEGLHLRRLDASPLALVRLARQMWTPEENDLWGVLDLGHHHTSLTVVVGPFPTYIRSLSTTADRWTQHLASALDVPYSVAERLKRAHGIQPGERRLRGSAGGVSSLAALDAGALPGVFFGLLRGALDDLVRDINRCFSYVLQNYAELNVTRLLLAGGGVTLGGLADYLRLQLGLTVTPLTNSREAGRAGGADPAQEIEFQPPQAAAVGGALLDLEAA